MFAYAGVCQHSLVTIIQHSATTHVHSVRNLNLPSAHSAARAGPGPQYHDVRRDRKPFSKIHLAFHPTLVFPFVLHLKFSQFLKPIGCQQISSMHIKKPLSLVKQIIRQFRSTIPKLAPVQLILQSGCSHVMEKSELYT